MNEADLSQEHRKAATKAVEELAKAGFMNMDLKWRHVGFYWDNQVLRSVMFDMMLVEVKEEEEEEERQNAVKKMLESLGLDPPPPKASQGWLL